MISVIDDVVDIFTYVNKQRLNRHKNKSVFKHCDPYCVCALRDLPEFLSLML